MTPSGSMPPAAPPAGASPTIVASEPFTFCLQNDTKLVRITQKTSKIAPFGFNSGHYFMDDVLENFWRIDEICCGCWFHVLWIMGVSLAKERAFATKLPYPHTVTIRRQSRNSKSLASRKLGARLLLHTGLMGQTMINRFTAGAQLAHMWLPVRRRCSLVATHPRLSR